MVGGGRLARNGRWALFALVILVAAGCATFKGELPVNVSIPERTYISPKNADGIQDRLVVPVVVPVAYAKMVVGGYRFSVQDATGRAIRTIEDIAVPRGSGKRFTFKQPAGVRVPDRLIWEGRWDDGSYAPDGEYSYGVEVWDAKGNVGESPRFIVVVDNTPPRVTVSLDHDTFSPNGDGSRDVLTIHQSDASAEDEWRGEIRNAAGVVVRTMRWTGVAPDFSWEGTDEAGAMVPDGAYTYTVSSTDRAGNRASVLAPDISVDTRPSGVALGATLRSFSPNGDGVRDAVAFLPYTDTPEAVVSWSVTVLDSSGAARRSFDGSGKVPERVEFDGKGDRGGVVPDGSYRAVMDLRLRNGSVPQAVSPTVTVDTVAPKATSRPEYLVFSPDGDGNRDTVTIAQETSDEDLWEGLFADASGRTVATRFWQGTAETFTWDGRDDAGAALPDGVYSYTLKSTDTAGNVNVAEAILITLDARPTPVAVSAEFAAFSPNGDGRRDTIRILLTVAVSEGIQSWSVEIADGGVVRRRFSGTGRPPSSVTFDGRNDAGAMSPESTGYSAIFRVLYEKGDRAVAISPSFALDTTPPYVRLSASYLLFSPDGDRRRDELTFYQSGSSEDLWLGAVVGASGRAVRATSWKGRPLPWTWDGRDADGKVVPDGEYTYRVSCTDAAENTSVSEIPGVRVDTRPVSAALSASAAGLSPNDDGMYDTVDFGVAARPADGVKGWYLSVMDSGGEVIRGFSGTADRPLPPRITWDGQNQAGKVVEGSFTASLSGR